VRPPFAFLVVLLAAPALATLALAGSGAGSAAPSPRSAAGRRAALDDALAQLELLSKKARVPTTLARIRAYRGMSPDQLADSKRGVDLDELLAILKRDDVPAEIRDEAANAIIWDQAQRSDPALDMGGRGLKRPRAAFTQRVLPLLTDANDLVGRGLAKRVCEGLWPSASGKDPALRDCDPRKKLSCQSARAAWEALLRR